MKKSSYSINEMHNAIRQIVEQINISGFNPEVIVSINRGGCIPGVYLSHFLDKPHKMIDIKSLNDNSENISSFFRKNKLVLIIDDINDTGKTFDFVKKTFNNLDCEIRFAALINNVTSKTKIDYHGQLIDKSESPVWYVFPWENWW